MGSTAMVSLILHYGTYHGNQSGKKTEMNWLVFMYIQRGYITCSWTAPYKNCLDAGLASFVMGDTRPPGSGELITNFPLILEYIAGTGSLSCVLGLQEMIIRCTASQISMIFLLSLPIL